MAESKEKRKALQARENFTREQFKWYLQIVLLRFFHKIKWSLATFISSPRVADSKYFNLLAAFAIFCFFAEEFGDQEIFQFQESASLFLEWRWRQFLGVNQWL